MRNLLLIILILFIFAIIIYVYLNDPEEKLRRAINSNYNPNSKLNQISQSMTQPIAQPIAQPIVQPIVQPTTAPITSSIKSKSNKNVLESPDDDLTSSITLSNTISNSKNLFDANNGICNANQKKITKFKPLKKVRFNNVVSFNTYNTTTDSASENEPYSMKSANTIPMPINEIPSDGYAINNYEINNNNPNEERWDSVFTRKLTGDAKFQPNLYVPCLNSYQVDPKSTIIDPSMVLQKIDITTDRIQGSKDKMGMKIKDIFNQQVANTKAVPKQLVKCGDSQWEYANESELNGGFLRNSPGLKGYQNGNLEDFFQGISYQNDF